MPREWCMKPTRDRKTLAAEAVINLLPRDGSELGWTDLRLKAEEEGMSSATLRAHLKRFGEMKIVVRRMDPSAYPPRVYYRMNVPRLFPMETYRFYLESKKLDDLRELVYRLNVLGPGGDLFDVAVRAHARMLTVALLAALRGSLEGKGPYGPFRTGELEGEGMERYLDQLARDVHDVADEQLDLVLRPWIHGLLDLAMYLSDSAEGRFNELGEEAAREAQLDLDSLNEHLIRARAELEEEANRHE